MSFGSKKQTIGYKYFLGMHMVLCQSKVDSLNKILVDNKTIWDGRQVGNGTINIMKPEIFGGDRSEGGISGSLDVQFGGPEQEANAYLVGQLGSIPASRGVLAVILKQMYLGASPYLKKWGFRVTRVYTHDRWYDAKAPIGGTASPGEPAQSGGRVAFVIDKSYSMNEFIYVPGHTSRKFNIAIKSMKDMLDHILYLSELGYPYDVAITFTNDYGKQAPEGNTNHYNTTETRVFPNFNASHYDFIVNDWIAPMFALKPDIYDPVNRAEMLQGIDGPKYLDESMFYTFAYDGRYLVYRESESVFRKAQDITDFFKPDEARINVMVSFGELQMGAPYSELPSPFVDDYRGTANPTIRAKGMLGKMLESGLVRYFGYKEDPSKPPIPWNTAKRSVVKYMPLTVNTKVNEYTDTPYYPSYPFSQDSKTNYGNFSALVNNPYCGNTWLDNTDGPYATALADFKKLLVWDYDAEPGDFYNADMNPAHIVRECLTNPIWGMGYPALDIDDAKFRYAADVFYEEQLGMTLSWEKDMTIEDFIKEVLRHVDAVLFVDRRSGKFVLKPIRADYDEEELLHLHESNVLTMSDFSKPTLGELVNSVTVNSRDLETNTETSVTVQNSALFMLQGAEISTKVQYPGIGNKRNAILLAQRDLRTLSTPLVKVTLEVSDIAENLNMGDCFVLSWDDYDLNRMVMRVMGIDYGTGTKHRVRIQAVQDVFSTPQAPLVKPPGIPWTNPTDLPATPVVDGLAVEAPYYELVQVLGQPQVDLNLNANPDIGLGMVSAVQPTYGSRGMVYVRDSYTSLMNYEGDVSFCQRAITLDPIIQIDDTVRVQMSDIAAATIRPGEWAQLDSEVIAIVSLVRESAGIWVLTIKRGVLDTQPMVHTESVAIYFVDAFNFLYQKEFAYGEFVEFGISTLNTTGESPVDAMWFEDIQFKSRAIAPYPPQNVKINNKYYNTDELSEITVTWAHRNRLQQTGANLLGFFDDSLSMPEPGTTYTVRLLDNINQVWLYTASGITSTAHTIPNGSIPFEYEDVWMYIIATRDGRDCKAPYVQKLFLAEPIGGNLEFKMDDFTAPPVGGNITIKLG